MGMMVSSRWLSGSVATGDGSWNPGGGGKVKRGAAKSLSGPGEVGQFCNRMGWDGMAWVEARWGIVYTYAGMRSVLKRHGLGLKVPRPQSEKADVKAQAAWQKKA
jgi:transposase